MSDLPAPRTHGWRGIAVPVLAGAVAVVLALTAAPAARTNTPQSAPTPAAGASAGASAPAGDLANADPLRLRAFGRDPGSVPALDPADRAAIQALLDQRAAAVRARDLDGYVVTGGGAVARSQAEALAALPVTQWSYSLGGVGYSLVDAAATETAQATYGSQTIVLRTTIAYRLDGFDRSTVTTTHDLTVRPDDTGWKVLVDRPVDDSKEIWDFGPITAFRGRRSLVVGLGSSAPSTATLQAYADAADVGVRDVTAVWGRDWQQEVLLVAPATVSAFARALGRDAAGYGQIAAVTTAELGSQAPVSRGDRVFVNPSAFAKLGPRGRTVVLRHEITHVATTAAAIDSMPTWMEEGFADYVGYRGSGVPRSQITAELAQWVRDGNRPRSLPGDDAYDGRSPDLVVAYEQSWLAARMIADEYGRTRTVELYRAMRDETAADPSGGTDTAFRTVLGISLATFTRQWRAQVRALGS